MAQDEGPGNLNRKKGRKYRNVPIHSWFAHSFILIGSSRQARTGIVRPRLATWGREKLTEWGGHEGRDGGALRSANRG